MYGRPDALIRSAPADIGHGFVDILVGRFRFSLEQRGGRHDLTGLAIAALRDVDGGPSFLHGMRRVWGEALDGDDAVGGLHVSDPDRAGALHLVIDVNRAGAALCDSTAIFGAGEADLLADDPQERGICLHLHVAHAAVDVELRHGRPRESELCFYSVELPRAREKRPA